MVMGKRRRIAFATAAVSAVLLAAGCGTGDDSGQSTLVQSAGGSGSANDGYGSDGYGSGGYGAQAGSSGSSAKGVAAQQLGIREIADVGPTVTDSRGFTLYRFDNDTPKPPASKCDGICADKWPPVPADDATASTGINPELLGAVQRADGSKQLTLAGWPVYRYDQDAKPGEAKGEGVGGTWHALGADGKPAKNAASKSGEEAADTGEEETEQRTATGGGDQLAAKQDAKLGTILVDEAGRTLYRFDKDSAWPMKTNCTGDCLKMWKPAKAVTDKSRVRGVDPKLVNTFTRPDGSKQLSIDCWIVYTYVGDTKPGDVNGQGKGGVWWAVKEDGKKAGASKS
ncbi:SCO0930 family lipoprotein [Streptomyces sp. NPDC006879]|uniref:SCO0930 family lipoprotein n=1 Tax=Streptomyces sp. NPDC006879 TaxID=3364767 RepID=UPI003674C104